MINQLLDLQRPLFVLDVESTGIDPQRDRIIELGFQQWTSEGMVKEWRTLINPAVSIPPYASKIHGIRDTDIQSCKTCGQSRNAHPCQVDVSMMCNNFTPWPSFRQLAPSLAKGFTDCDYAGQNVRFDLRIVAAEMARAGQEWSFGRACVIDSLRLEGIVEPRSLTHLHKKYVGLPHDGAHGALSDVRAAATVITKQLEVHTQLPRSVHALHDLQWPDWIDTEGKFKFVSGVPYFTSWGKYANQPMSKADVGYWNFILSKDFSNEIKAIASAAKLGTFPTREA